MLHKVHLRFINLAHVYGTSSSDYYIINWIDIYTIMHLGEMCGKLFLSWKRSDAKTLTNAILFVYPRLIYKYDTDLAKFNSI